MLVIDRTQIGYSVLKCEVLTAEQLRCVLQADRAATPPGSM